MGRVTFRALSAVLAPSLPARPLAGGAIPTDDRGRPTSPTSR